MFTAINDGLRQALKTDDKVVCFGEDVGFGGVFRCTVDLREEFGADRVFNTPLAEQGVCVCVWSTAKAYGTATSEYVCV
jgi:2-oxoisovalerate dehydrogenase E1 component beta subunit